MTDAKRPPARTWLPWSIAILALALLAWTWWSRAPAVQGVDAGEAATTAAEAPLEARELPVDDGAGRVPDADVPLPPQVAGERVSIRERVTGTRPRTAEEVAAERERLVRDLESRFAADAEDPSGGPPAELRLSEVAIGDAMAPTGIAPSELKVDCKSSMCRVQGVFDNPGNAQDWGMFYLSAAGGELASSRIISQRRPDGSVQLSIYGTRGEPPR